LKAPESFYAAFCSTAHLRPFQERGNKPDQLLPVEFGSRPPTRPVLNACVGKEDGHVYYASKKLHSSPSAVALLGAAPHMQAAYSRMPLLPSMPMAFPPDLEVTLTPEPWSYQRGYILVVNFQVLILPILNPLETNVVNLFCRLSATCFPVHAR
jgi:hypothetical protein